MVRWSLLVENVCNSFCGKNILNILDTISTLMFIPLFIWTVSFQGSSQESGNHNLHLGPWIPARKVSLKSRGENGGGGGQTDRGTAFSGADAVLVRCGGSKQWGKALNLPVCLCSKRQLWWSTVGNDWKWMKKTEITNPLTHFVLKIFI